MTAFYGKVLAFLAVATLLGTSCGPTAAPRPTEGAGAHDQIGSARTLRLGMNAGSEPREGVLFGTGTGPQELVYSFHSGLTAYNPDNQLIPQIAQKVPSIEDGDWKVFPDGRMEVTWKLQPDVRWHDGSPLAAEDYVFGSRVRNDPAIPFRRPPQMKLISQVVALDPGTVLVTWSAVHILATQAGPVDFLALPRHLLLDAYEKSDNQPFMNEPYWTSEFIGLGPYRLGEWLLGAFTEGVAFDQYFLGRPKIGRIVYRYYGNDDAVMAAQLSGEIDMAPVGTFRWEHLRMFRNDWEPSGAGVAVSTSAGTRNALFQFRDPAAPWAKDLRVREAVQRMINKQSLADDFRYGLTRPADTNVAPEDPIYALLEQRGFPRYPYDLGRAQQLMADARWTRGADGGYRSAEGEPFTLEVRFRGKSDNILEGNILVAMLKDAGVIASAFIIPDSASTSEKVHQSNLATGLYAGQGSLGPDPMGKFTTSQIGTEAKRWTEGGNFGGYSNPTMDRLSAQFTSTMDSRLRDPLLAEMLQVEAQTIPDIHFYYDISTNVATIRKGLRGPGPVSRYEQVNAWNIHTWELD